jgi:hypothetical protein
MTAPDHRQHRSKNSYIDGGIHTCIVDDTGRIVREVKVASEPEALLAVLTNPIYRFCPTSGPLIQN